MNYNVLEGVIKLGHLKHEAGTYYLTSSWSRDYDWKEELMSEGIHKQATMLEVYGYLSDYVNSITTKEPSLAALQSFLTQFNLLQHNESRLHIPGTIVGPTKGIQIDVASNEASNMKTGYALYPRDPEPGVRPAEGTALHQLISTMFECSLEDSDNENLDALERFLGACVLGVPEQKCLWLHGKGGNGKSQLLNAIGYAMGSASGFSNSGVFTKSFDGSKPRGDIVSTLHKRLNIISEWPREIINSGLYKSLTGGDFITARGMWAEAVPTQSNGCFVVATNHLPKFDEGINDAILRRTIIVRAMGKTDKPDPLLPQKIREEGGVVWSWLMHCARKYASSGSVPMLGGDVLKVGNDSVTEFMELLAESADADQYRTNDSLWSDYCSYLVNTGEIKDYRGKIEDTGEKRAFLKRVRAAFPHAVKRKSGSRGFQLCYIGGVNNVLTLPWKGSASRR